jgi:hypothetical protein
MSARFAVGTSPVQILYGTQDSPQIVLNSGTTSAYLSDDSNPSAGFDFTLGAGESIVVDSETVLWATSTGSGTTLTTLNGYADRFGYTSPLTRLLSVSGSPSGTLSYDSTAPTQYQSVSISLYLNNSAIAGTWGFGWTDIGVPAGTPNPNGGTLGIYSLAGTEGLIPVTTAGLSVVAGSGSPLMTGVIPVLGYGGSWQVIAPSGAPSDSYLVAVTGLSSAVQQPLWWSQTNVSIASTPQWVLYCNTYTNNQVTVGAAATVDTAFPLVSGPVRVTVTWIQSGAGTSSATVVANVGTYSGGVPISTAKTPYDAALGSASAAGTYTYSAQYAVWPSSPMYLRLATTSTATITSAVIVLTAGLQ